MAKRKQVPLGPGPDEIAAAQGIDLSRPRRARGRVTQTIRGKEDPRLKAKRHRQEFFKNIDKKKMRKSDVPDNCALFYVEPFRLDEFLNGDSQLVYPKLERGLIQGEAGRGMTVVIVNKADITKFHITHILGCDEDFWKVK